MRPFQYLDQPLLLDLLAHVTSEYTKKYSNKIGNTDTLACLEVLLMLQAEIDLRRNTSN